jgi:hypothetical protein
MVGTQDPHAPSSQVTLDLLSAASSPKGLMLFGYVSGHWHRWSA